MKLASLNQLIKQNKIKQKKILNEFVITVAV